MRPLAAAILACALLFLTGFDPFTAKAPEVEEGNAKVKAGDYPGGLDRYDQAEQQYGGKAEIYYNRGVASFHKGDYAGARDNFLKAIGPGNPALNADNYFNLGNSYFQLKDLDKAIEAYKETLKVDPQHLGARRNLELALWQRYLQQQQQKQQQSDKNKDDQKQDKQDQEQQKDQKKQDEPDKTDQQKAQEEQKPEEQPQQQPPPEQKPEEQKPEAQKPEQSPAQQMEQKENKDENQQPADEAARVLDALRAQEQALQRERFTQNKQVRRSREKDW